MSEYKATIGLEIHAELSTETKMFCNSMNDSNERRPNVNICPVCMAHPGTLPVINKKAVKHVLRVGSALGSQIADFTEFDRKNYFYPDIPKGYQISQYKYPLVSGGSLSGAEITRIHLEEDTARSTHDTHDTQTLIDFNRAGVPLMELVTEPVIKDAEHAVIFAKELQLLLRYLGASEANMEKGEMRVEANVSVSKTKEFGTKVEVKNLNSFKVVGKAIEYEIERQIETLEDGGEIVQETRGWDENKGKTFSQRKKETSEDYRYFPEPDLPKLKLSEIEDFKNIEKELPELPWEKRERLGSSYGLKNEDIDVFISNIPLAHFFESTMKLLKEDKESAKLVSNYMTSDIQGFLKKGEHTLTDNRIGMLDPENFAHLIEMVREGEVSSRGAKEILSDTLSGGKSVRVIAEEKELFQKSDKGELEKIVKKIISENEGVVLEYKGGKEKSLQFLIGQAMRQTKGSANPQVLTDIFKKLIT